ncbi:MAG: hypothetical protein V1808_03480 [Candidatus Daviesbacteria bacterium]
MADSSQQEITQTPLGSRLDRRDCDSLMEDLQNYYSITNDTFKKDDQVIRLTLEGKLLGDENKRVPNSVEILDLDDFRDYEKLLIMLNIDQKGDSQEARMIYSQILPSTQKEIIKITASFFPIGSFEIDYFDENKGHPIKQHFFVDRNKSEADETTPKVVAKIEEILNHVFSDSYELNFSYPKSQAA